LGCFGGKMERIKFYDAVLRKPVMVPKNVIEIVYKQTKRRKVKMLKTNYKGHVLWKIVG